MSSRCHLALVKRIYEDGTLMKMDKATKRDCTAANNLRETVEDLLRASPRIPTDVIAGLADINEAYVLELAAAEDIPIASPTDRTPMLFMDDAGLKAFRALTLADQRGVRAFRELANEQKPGRKD